MEKYTQMLRNAGADSATIINTQSIVTAPWPIYKCQFGCARYGKNLCCPPKSPSYKETQEILDSYEKAVLFRCHDMSIVTDLAVEVAKEMFLDGYYKVIVLGSGPCKKCSECNMNVCHFPGQTAPSMEACGIDVFQTVRKNGYEIATLRNKTETPNFFGLILVE